MNQLSLCLFLPLWKTVWKQWALLLCNGCVFCLGRANACLSLTPWLLWVSTAADCRPDCRGRTPWDCRMPSVAPWKPPGCSWCLSLCTEPSVLCTGGLLHLARQQEAHSCLRTAESRGTSVNYLWHENEPKCIQPPREGCFSEAAEHCLQRDCLQWETQRALRAQQVRQAMYLSRAATALSGCRDTKIPWGNHALHSPNIYNF